MAQRGEFRFFISKGAHKQEPDAKSSADVYGYSEERGFPDLSRGMPDVVLFGGMKQSYCKSLALAIYVREGVRLSVPKNYPYPGFHGDERTLSYIELVSHLENMVGEFKYLPPHSIISMELFFEYLKKAFSQKAQSFKLSLT